MKSALEQARKKIVSPMQFRLRLESTLIWGRDRERAKYKHTREVHAYLTVAEIRDVTRSLYVQLRM